ncbi:sensor histidine kinase [Halopseudomonas xiamenensis]|uniref:sensor histidine kinase n=1 Tax=Halopseudomonas xiamenensis TaxID=157792 RepID=UPI001623F880|nr:ATP-binding protein [Halopseudomonas xiamenensis]
MLLLWALPLLGQACPQWITAMEAARELGDDGQRPAEGWEAVSLPDIWTKRWPEHSGSVWYRLDLDDACLRDQPVALSIAGLTLAGMLYVNDELLWRDSSLSEPLSRSWNIPRYWLLPTSTLRPEGNSLWLRVTGKSYSLPGLRQVEVGQPEYIWQLHQQQWWQQRTSLVINMIVSLVMATLFSILWLLHRSESAFGWFALSSWCWAVFTCNALAYSPWPFTNSADWQRLNTSALVLYCFTSSMFIWRFGKQHFPRLGRYFRSATLLTLLLVWLVPERHLIPVLIGAASGFILLYMANCLQFQWHAYRHPQRHNVLLAACLLLFLGIMLHDILAAAGMTNGRQSQVQLTSLITPVLMFLIVAWRFTENQQRIERFNEDLLETATRTRNDLTHTLSREHQLEMENTRLNERLVIAHDLHDSLGSSLMRSIATVEQSAEPPDRTQFLSMLKMLRDDLRQIIDNSSASTSTVSATPTDWLAPLRHRFVHLFDELGLESQWQLPSQWPCNLSSAEQLTLTRFLEEALTNIIKHSHARSLSISMEPLRGGGMQLVVTDDGMGFDVAAIQQAGQGVGMRSMHARIARIGGQLHIHSRPGETILSVTLQQPDQSQPQTQLAANQAG